MKSPVFLLLSAVATLATLSCGSTATTAPGLSCNTLSAKRCTCAPSLLPPAQGEVTTPSACSPATVGEGAVCCASAATGWSSCSCALPSTARADIGCRGSADFCACSISSSTDPFTACPAPPTNICCQQGTGSCACTFATSCTGTQTQVTSCAAVASPKCCASDDGNICSCTENGGTCSPGMTEVTGCEVRTGLCCKATDGKSCTCGRQAKCEANQVPAATCDVELLVPALVTPVTCKDTEVKVADCLVK